MLFQLADMTRRTARYRIHGLEHLYACRAENRPVIWTAWHGMTMLLAAGLLQHVDPERFVLLLPDEWRGAALAHFATRMRAHPFRMDVSGADPSMGAARRLLKLVGMVRGGMDCYITPDGPDGPAFVPKPGIAFIAARSGAVILPVGGHTRTAYRLNRWDEYRMPLPYSRIHVVIGAPVVLTKDAAANTRRLTGAMHRVSAAAVADYYGAWSGDV